MDTRSLRSWRHLLVVGASALAVVSCTTSGSNDSADPTTTEPSGRDFTTSELQAILPTAAEVGQGYRVKPDTGGGNNNDVEVEAALTAACPGIEEAFANFGTEDDDGTENENVVEVSMEDDDERGFEVKVNAEPSLDPATVDGQIDVINGCEPFTFDGGDGSDITMTMQADRTDAFGEVAVDFTLELLIENDQLPVPVDLTFASRSFLVDTVSVTVTVSDGLDTKAFETIGRDTDLLEEFSAEMETRVTDLVAG